MSYIGFLKTITSPWCKKRWLPHLCPVALVAFHGWHTSESTDRQGTVSVPPLFTKLESPCPFRGLPATASIAVLRGHLGTFPGVNMSVKCRKRGRTSTVCLSVPSYPTVSRAIVLLGFSLRRVSAVASSIVLSLISQMVKWRQEILVGGLKTFPHQWNKTSLPGNTLSVQILNKIKY